MSTYTRRLRWHIPGESFEDWLARQHTIDEYQLTEIDPTRTWTTRGGWGESYDLDYDEREERRIIKQLEDEVWNPVLDPRLDGGPKHRTAHDLIEPSSAEILGMLD